MIACSVSFEVVEVVTVVLALIVQLKVVSGTHRHETSVRCRFCRLRVFSWNRGVELPCDVPNLLEATTDLMILLFLLLKQTVVERERSWLLLSLLAVFAEVLKADLH